MQIDWKDGFGSWTAIPDPDLADGPQVTFADEGLVIGASGNIAAPADDARDAAGVWRDGFGDWAS